MKIKITFSKAVKSNSCSAAINGIPWKKTGPRSGEVDGIPSGTAACGWWVAGNSGDKYTITLENAVWNSPVPQVAVKTRPILNDGSGYGTNGITVIK